MIHLHSINAYITPLIQDLESKAREKHHQKIDIEPNDTVSVYDFIKAHPNAIVDMLKIYNEPSFFINSTRIKTLVEEVNRLLDDHVVVVASDDSEKQDEYHSDWFYNTSGVGFSDQWYTHNQDNGYVQSLGENAMDKLKHIEKFLNMPLLNDDVKSIAFFATSIVTVYRILSQIIVNQDKTSRYYKDWGYDKVLQLLRSFSSDTMRGIEYRKEYSNYIAEFGESLPKLPTEKKYSMAGEVDAVVLLYTHHHNTKF